MIFKKLVHKRSLSHKLDRALVPDSGAAAHLAIHFAEQQHPKARLLSTGKPDLLTEERKCLIN